MLNPMVEYSLARLDDTYGALAHVARRSILAGLRGGEARVTELAEPFDVSLAAVSKHVRILERAGLVRRTVLGRDHWIAIDPDPLGEASGWLEEYRAFWEHRLDALESMLRKRR